MPNLTSLYLTVYNFINIPIQLSGKLLAKMHLDKRLHKKKKTINRSYLKSHY